MVERVTNMSLNDYMQQHIFAPFDIKNISVPHGRDEVPPCIHSRTRPAQRQTRRPRALTPTSTRRAQRRREEVRLQLRRRRLLRAALRIYQDYRHASQHGISPTNAQILKTGTVEEIFKNQIPEMPNFGRKLIPDVMPHLTNPIPELYAQPHDQPQGWGLTFMLTIHKGVTGRGASTGWWAWLPNLYWWADRDNGVGGIVASQILPFAGMFFPLLLWLCSRR